MFDYLRFEAVVIENGTTYAVPDQTFEKEADTGLRIVLGKAYSFALYRVDFSDGSESEYRLYSAANGEDPSNVTSISYTSYDPSATFNDSDSRIQLDYYGTYATRAEGITAMNAAIPVVGCRDPSATNFNDKATVEDGSCKYGKDYTGLILVGGLVLAALVLTQR